MIPHRFRIFQFSTGMQLCLSLTTWPPPQPARSKSGRVTGLEQARIVFGLVILRSGDQQFERIGGFAKRWVGGDQDAAGQLQRALMYGAGADDPLIR